MIRIDDSLLEELGLIALPEVERKQMLKQIYETLEMRVGMRLAERMSDQQLDEFERFIDGDVGFVEGYLNANKPNWQQSPEYLTAHRSAQENAQKSGVELNENAVKSEYGALAWLEINFPDYKQVVASELEKLKGEIKQDSHKIIEAMQLSGGVASQPQAQAENVVPANFSQNQQPQQPYQTIPPPPPQPPYDQNQQPPMAA